MVVVVIMQIAINFMGAVKMVSIEIVITIVEQGTTNHPTATSTTKWARGYDIPAVLPARGAVLV